MSTYSAVSRSRIERTWSAVREAITRGFECNIVEEVQECFWSLRGVTNQLDLYTPPRIEHIRTRLRRTGRVKAAVKPVLEVSQHRQRGFRRAYKA